MKLLTDLPLPLNQVLHGDCTQMLRTLPDSSVDLVLMDPPYGVGYRERNGRKVANDDDLSILPGCFEELYRVLKPDSFCITFYGWSRVDAFAQAWTNANFRPVGHLVWHKPYASRSGYLRGCHERAFLLANGSPRRSGEPLDDVQPWEYSGNKHHPTEKSVSILRPLVEAFSAPGDVVLDPFAGSGSTLVAASLSRRRYIGIELIEEYCEVARRRATGAARHLDQHQIYRE